MHGGAEMPSSSTHMEVERPVPTLDSPCDGGRGGFYARRSIAKGLSDALADSTASPLPRRRRAFDFVPSEPLEVKVESHCRHDASLGMATMVLDACLNRRSIEYGMIPGKAEKVRCPVRYVVVLVITSTLSDRVTSAG